MNIRTKLILSVGILAGMIILLVALSVVNLQILTATEPDSPAAMPGLERALLWISVTGAICILASIVLLVWLPRSINKPIQELTRGILEIANHNYEKRLDMSGHEEFRQVADSFNSMAERLTEYRASTLNDILSAKKFLEAVVNSIHEPIIGLNCEHEILFINKEALTVLNLKREDVIRHSAEELSLKNDLLRRLVRELITPGEKKEPLKIYADNKESYFQASYITIINTDADTDEPQNLGDVILLKNITEFKELDSAKTTFISTISHELKTPISAILMSLQLLEDKRVGALNDEQEQLSKSIKENADRLLGITGELLNMTQVEANRYYGMTASQTLQALQELYEEKLVTYPRTDSQFVTEDMRTTVESLVLALDGQTVDVSCVINNSKVTDHHAILPTMQSVKCSKEKLSETKQRILSLIIWKLLLAVQPPFIYEDVLVTVCCQGQNFTAKYKEILQPGYTAKPVPFVEPEKDKVVPLPKKMEQGMVLPVVRAEKKQGFTSPPKVYTEDTLLSAMETAGNKEFEKDTEKKGLGTPATRAAILEKLVSAGYVQRKGKQMIPTEDGVAAIRNIPDYLKSSSMTAEWENDLLRMERGEIKPYDFMQGIHGLLDKMLADLRQIPTVAAAPNHNKVSVGSCPVCGNPVHESKLSFCCADRSCKFALWKESRYLSNMRKTLDKKMAVDLLKKGRTHVKDFYSAKKDKTFAADLVMRVEEGRAQYSLEFPKTPMKTKT